MVGLGGGPPTVVLIGMMGCGKSTVGAALAEITGWPYLDNDELVQAATGRPSEEIAVTDGEAALHEAEAAALRHALALPPPLIAGAAAWVVLDPGSVDLLRRQPAVVYLRAHPETLRARIGAGEGRREDATDLEWLRARSAERDATYRDVANITIDTDGLHPRVIAERIGAALGIDPTPGASAHPRS
jgi:shikimate kinase